MSHLEKRALEMHLDLLNGQGTVTKILGLSMHLSFNNTVHVLLTFHFST